MLSWIRAALSFTATLQRSNGSFDEWYVHEGSYVGTAFLTAALSQTILLLRAQSIVIPEHALIQSTIERSAQFLLKTEEKTVLNQMSGAIFAVYATGLVLENNFFKQRAESLLEQFLALQNEEGWWSEYGGPDIGYLSLTISYLHKYDSASKNDRARGAIVKARRFIELFVHPDETAGGEYMARNTEYLIPSGALPFLGAVRPAHLDDRYLCYILYNWFEAGLHAGVSSFPKLTSTDYFPNCTILRDVHEAMFFVASGIKGGSFRIYQNGKVYYDCGIEVRDNTNVYSTGILDAENIVDYADGVLRVRGYAKPIKEPLLQTNIMIPFKAVQLLLGRFDGLQKIVKTILRRRMISYATQSSIRFERTITHNNHQKIIVRDVVYTTAKAHDILWGMKAAYTAVPSSKYAPVMEVTSQTFEPTVEKTQEDTKITIVRTFTW
jgi:hypothetical protein